jgi:geranylgeranyl diphosphate synthase type II
MITVPLQKGQEVQDRDSLAEAFRNSLPISRAVDLNFEQTLRHVLDHPGSLIRPRLVVQIATGYGLSTQSALDLAIALEYFHSASLLFDDLPSMDNALERRGVPCTHMLFGESGAILAALGLINRAYALTWRAVAGCEKDKQQNALEFLEQRLGVEGLLNGQSMDLNYSLLPHSRTTTEKIARGKTVSLIRLALVLPAMLGNATRRELQLLERMATHWGLAYQVLDDLKDLLQGVEATGKTSARDMLLDRPNTASVLGIQPAVERVERLIRAGNKALHHLRALRGGLDFLETLRSKFEEELLKVATEATGPLVGAAL